MHAIIAAFLLWITAGVIALAGPGLRSVTGPLKGTDFVHFYTLGHEARSGRTDFYDGEKLYRMQVSLVPESSPDRYPPAVYPPLVALVFTPLSLMPYGIAALAWAAINMLGYALIISAVWRQSGFSYVDRSLVIAAAAAFPPFWNLLLHGQTTLIPLVAFYGGWVALRHGRPIIAGFVLGFLALKPQLGLVFAVVVLAGGEWWMLCGVAISIGLQLLATVIAFSDSALFDYGRLLLSLPSLTAALSAKPYQMHSVAALTRLIPHGELIWLGASALITWRTVLTWRAQSSASMRMAVLVIATVLVSPHLFVYDATLLALPFLWVASEVVTHGAEGEATTLGATIYWLSVTLLVPTALLIGVQLSVIILIALFAQVSGWALQLDPRRSVLLSSAASFGNPALKFDAEG